MEGMKVPLQLFYLLFWLMLGWHLKIQYELETSLSFSSLVSIELVWDAHHLSLIIFSLGDFSSSCSSAVQFSHWNFILVRNLLGLWGSCCDSVSSLKPVCCSGWLYISCSNCFCCSFSFRFRFYTVVIDTQFKESVSTSSPREVTTTDLLVNSLILLSVCTGPPEFFIPGIIYN